jgi:tetratricopeptide (TPR) repeat protein
MALTMAESRGELGKRHEGYEDQFARLRHVKMLDESRQHYEAGLLCSRGHLFLFRTGTGPMDCADRVDAMGGQHARVVAQCLRASYYRFRGENSKANEAEGVLDAMAAQYGHRWVPDILAVWDLVPYHLAGDVVGLKRVLHRTERSLSYAPAFTLHRDILRAMYEGHRGHPEVALSIYEGLSDRVAPFTSPVWSFAQAHQAECLNALERHAEALVVCEEALRHIGPLARVYVVAYQQLEREAAVAMAHIGRADEAARTLDELLALHENDSHPLLVGLLNRDRARVALLANDRAAFEQHAARTTIQFSSTGNATLIAQAHRLARSARTAVGNHGAPASPELDDEAMLLKAVAGAPLGVMAQRALEHIVTLSGASRAYLYLLDNGALILAARHGDADAMPPLESQVQRLLDSYTEGCDIVTKADEATPRDPSSFTLVPLIVDRDGEPHPVGAAALFDFEGSRLTPRHLARLAAALQAGAPTVRARAPLHGAGDSPQ